MAFSPCFCVAVDIRCGEGIQPYFMCTRPWNCCGLLARDSYQFCRLVLMSRRKPSPLSSGWQKFVYFKVEAAGSTETFLRRLLRNISTCLPNHTALQAIMRWFSSWKCFTCVRCWRTLLSFCPSRCCSMPVLFSGCRTCRHQCYSTCCPYCALSVLSDTKGVNCQSIERKMFQW